MQVAMGSAAKAMPRAHLHVVAAGRAGKYALVACCSRLHVLKRLPPVTSKALLDDRLHICMREEDMK